MLVYTVKNYINYLKQYAGGNKYELTLVGAETKNKYTFIIEKEIRLIVNKSGIDCLLMTIENIEQLQLLDINFYPKKLIETTYKPDGTMYERTDMNIQYSAPLYVKLFRLMRERVSFVFRQDDTYHYCYYVDGKVLYIEEDETDYNVKGTSLFQLEVSHPGHEILYVSPPMRRYSYGEYMDTQHAIARNKGKTFGKFKFDRRIKTQG